MQGVKNDEEQEAWKDGYEERNTEYGKRRGRNKVTVRGEDTTK